jgi:xylulokinase
MTAVVIGVDLGTTSCKAGAFSLDGQQLGHGIAPCRVSRSFTGWVEQDPRHYWDAAAAAIRQALIHIEPTSVLAIACCGHTPGLVLVDHAGRPVRPAIIWQDTRATAEATALDAEISPAQWRDWLGMELPRNASYPPARLRWLHLHEPDVLDRTYKLLQPKDVINYHLTGIMASDYWSSKGLVHLVTGEPVAAYRDLLAIDPMLAPGCRYPHHLLGSLVHEAAERLGLPAGVPVATGWSDAMCGMLGTGALAAGGMAFDIAGTSEIVGLTSEHEPAQHEGVLVAPVLDTPLRIVYGPTQMSGGAIQWFLTTFWPDRESAGARTLDDCIAPTADRLLFLPYLEGERAPIWNAQARGVFFRLSSTHTREQVLRSILEGVGFSIRHVLEAAERATGITPVEVQLSGGGVISHTWNQIKADVLGKTIYPTVVRDGGTLGAAMLAAMGVQYFPDIGSASAAMVRVEAPLEPVSDRRQTYQQLYEEYRRLYYSVRDLY